jgi:hypothetical protein
MNWVEDEFKRVEAEKKQQEEAAKKAEAERQELLQAAPDLWSRVRDEVKSVVQSYNARSARKIRMTENGNAVLLGFQSTPGNFFVCQLAGSAVQAHVIVNRRKMPSSFDLQKLDGHVTFVSQGTIGVAKPITPAEMVEGWLKGPLFG